MSCYEWEKGTIVIPAAAWPKFKKSVITAYNARQDEALLVANEIHSTLMKAAQGQRNFNWKIARNNYLSNCWKASDESGEMAYQIINVLFPSSIVEKTGEAGKPKLPRRSNFPHANGATKMLSIGEASIRFDEAIRTVIWQVYENNHACEIARKHPVAKAFFNALKAVPFTRGSGGEIVGNNEYNKENDSAGGGGNFVVETFGPNLVVKPVHSSYSRMRF